MLQPYGGIHQQPTHWPFVQESCPGQLWWASIRKKHSLNHSLSVWVLFSIINFLHLLQSVMSSICCGRIEICVLLLFITRCVCMVVTTKQSEGEDGSKPGATRSQWLHVWWDGTIDSWCSVCRETCAWVKVSRSWWRCCWSSTFHLPREFCIFSGEFWHCPLAFCFISKHRLPGQ